jgi:hypothetical protein
LPWFECGADQLVDHIPELTLAGGKHEPEQIGSAGGRTDRRPRVPMVRAAIRSTAQTGH